MNALSINAYRQKKAEILPFTTHLLKVFVQCRVQDGNQKRIKKHTFTI